MAPLHSCSGAPQSKSREEDGRAGARHILRFSAWCRCRSTTVLASSDGEASTVARRTYCERNALDHEPALGLLVELGETRERLEATSGAGSGS